MPKRKKKRKELYRVGKFRIMEPRGARGIFLIEWTETDGTPNSKSTRTSDLEQAKAACDQFAAANGGLNGVAPLVTDAAKLDPLMLDVLALYWQDRAQKKARGGELFAHVIKVLTETDAAKNPDYHDVAQEWHALRVSEITKERQKRLVERFRGAGLTDGTVTRFFGAWWPALRYAAGKGGKSGQDGPDKPISTIVPRKIQAADWPGTAPRKGPTKPKDAIPIETVARLFNTVPATVGELLDKRFSVEHWWRFLVLSYGTAGRAEALRELTWAQVWISPDLSWGTIQLNPDERDQTDKRRPTVPIGPMLCREISSWARTSDYVIDRGDGKPLATSECFDSILERAGLDCAGISPHTSKHVISTWLNEHDCDSKEERIFTGHASLQEIFGKVHAGYIHTVARRPSYLSNARDLVDLFFATLAPLVNRSLGGYCHIEQPEPDSWPAVTSLSMLVGATGIEPATSCMSSKRSTTELRANELLGKLLGKSVSNSLTHNENPLKNGTMSRCGEDSAPDAAPPDSIT